MAPRRRPALIPPGGPLWFPQPEQADKEGLLAVGGDLEPERLLLAYDQGIFPWYSEGLPPLWWSPDPRALVDASSLYVSRRFARELRQQRFEVSFDRAFSEVMLACGRERSEGTWILPDMVAAYARLHELGHAHSFEVWRDGALVGGLYGVQRGGLFAAESMFHRETSASKVALVAAVRSLFRAGIVLFDVQFLTAHLASMGAYEVSRGDYLARLRAATGRVVTLRALPVADLSSRER